MTTKISLNSHISRKSTDAITKICKPLFDKTCITYFCYLRRYQDNTFTFLPTLIDMGEYFFEDGQYPLTWFAGMNFNDFQSGYYFWDIARQVSLEACQNIYSEVTKRLNLKSGVDIVEKTENYCDFFSFSSATSNIYFVPLDYLYEFVYYFKQQTRGLLLKSYEDRFLLEEPSLYLPPIPFGSTAGMEHNFKDDPFNIQRYYLSEEIFLTRREVEILRKLDKGEPVKCLADQMCISPRTLEQHVVNIKNKFNVSRTQEMLHLAKLHHILR